MKLKRIIIQMDESVYSSEVKNIEMILDTFLAGIIEGTLNESTQEEWSVQETKCLANGDGICEFVAKRG